MSSASEPARPKLPETPDKTGTPCNKPAHDEATPCTPQPVAEPGEPMLPPLKPHEFRTYNRMAEKMELFHNHFRQTWTMLHTACVDSRRPARMTLKQFIDEGLRFCQSLTLHHDIEEAHIFPRLATRMPEFQKPFASQIAKSKAANAGAGAGPGPGPGSLAPMDEKRARLVIHHRKIHKGMDELEKYLQECRNSERELEMRVMLERMDSWGAVLWEHLEEEVSTLGADNMRRYWSIEEMRAMPF